MDKYTLKEWLGMRQCYRALRLLRRNEPESMPDTLQESPSILHNALSLGLCLALAGLMLIAGCQGLAHADTINLKASWYSTASLIREGTYKHSKGVMANGHIFNDNANTCATRLFSLGSILRIQERTSGRCVNVTVTDRIGKRFAKQRIDLSRKAFARISSLNKGLINVTVERIG